MTFVEILAELVAELDRIHVSGNVVVSKLDRGVLPTFKTAKSGHQIHFTLPALRSIATISDLFYKGTPARALQIRIEEYTELVTQAVAECFAAGDFDVARHSVEDSKKLLKRRVERAIKKQRVTFTHYFPAWTLGVEATQKFAIGPVRFLSRQEWIDSVQIHDPVAHALSPNKSDLLSWKRRLRKLEERTARRVQKEGIADWIHRAIKVAPAVLKIRIVGSEIVRSQQLARYACKIALDSLSLLFDNNIGEQHCQFVLADERLIPIRQSTLVEACGRLWIPGSRINKRGWIGSEADAVAIANSPGAKRLLSACGNVIKAMLNPSLKAHPGLAQRWATSLSVYSEGCREMDDALALAKIGASMDILSGGGEEAGIRKMLLHLTGASESDILVKVPHPLTFKQVVSRIYSYGRSQFLHGNHIDPMIRFTSERHHATQLARIALRETVLRLVKFTGPDVANAFRTI
jgi:hypothetical protein